MMSVTRCTEPTISPSSAPLRPPGGCHLDLVHAGADQALDLLGRLGAALRQVAHLASDHRKAPALFTGTRGFHRRVERQDVGLEGDAVDHADDVGDLLGAVVDLVHGADHLAHHLAAARGHLGGWTASWLAWRAASALWRTVLVSSSMLAAVSSRLLAACSVRATGPGCPGNLHATPR
jgi:hypothetical protein